MELIPPYYPLRDFDPLMKGMVIGGMGIVHVFLAQFAVGGGMLLCYFQWLAQTGREAAARRFVDGYFKALVLVSFVLGVVTGVGMWLTAIQVSPRTIGLMVHEFHWIWATEWTFFCLEVVSGYAFYRYGARLTDAARLTLLALYSAAAWMSLFWINGILSWQLTPGRWVDTHALWAAFFNASFWPSLLYRTLSSLTIAALVACIVINAMRDASIADRARLVHRAANLLAPMVLMPALGVWFLQVLPADSRSWLLGGSPAMTLFLIGAVGASLLLGAYAFFGLVRRRLYINAATASLLLALAAAATACGEFVREGSRKPYTVRDTLFAHAVTPAEVVRLREVGCVTHDPYPLPDPGAYANPQVTLGARVFRFHCSVCHTLDAANGLSHLTGTWGTDQKRLNIAKLQYTKPFMPPFTGTPAELEALVQFLEWHHAGRPGEWPMSADPKTLAQIAAWLDEAGTRPAAAIGGLREGRR